MFLPYFRNPSLVLTILFSLVLGGCSTPSKENRNTASTSLDRPSFSARETFFDGKVQVEANLGRGFRGAGRGPRAEGRHGGGHRHSGGPGPRPAPNGDDADGFQPMIREANLPPVALRLRLTNTGNETIEVVFTLCKSELGDFAVQPEKLALAPGQVADPEAMTSRLGFASEELVLHLALRAKGKTEQKDLLLRRGEPASP